jgi:HEAT repeat protein
MSPRAIRERIFAILKSPRWKEKSEYLRNFSASQVLSHLLSFLCSEDEEMKWRAVTATGILVADLAQRDLERARNILRRMIWLLNDESGGIGWGVPEAMGEILGRNETLTREFAPILVSYIQPGGNFLEFELLQRGALWAIGRLAEANPQLLHALHAGEYLGPYLASSDPSVRGHALWALGRMGIQGSLPKAESLLRDETEIAIYQGQGFRSVRIRDLAKEALEPSSWGSPR